jgi:hypothetical protein
MFSVGYLLLQVTAARWTEREIANRLDFPPITQGEFFNSYAIPIWPSSGELSITWPPALSIGNELFETFSKRFEEFTLPPWMGRSKF